MKDLNITENGPWLTDIPIGARVTVQYDDIKDRQGVIIPNSDPVMHTDIDIGWDAEDNPNNPGAPCCYAILYDGEHIAQATYCEFVTGWELDQWKCFDCQKTFKDQYHYLCPICRENQ